MVSTNLHSNFSKFILAFILIAVPLFPKFPFINVPGTFVSIRLEDFLILFAGLSLLYNFSGKVEDFKKYSLWKSIMIYLLVGLVSVLSAVFISKTVSPHIGILHLVRRAEYFVPFFAAFYLFKYGKKNLEFFIKTLVAVVIVVFMYGVGQKYYSFPVIITQNEEYSKGVALRYVEGGHLNSTFAGHYDLGTFLVLILPIIVATTILVKGRISKLVLFLTLSMGLWLLVNTASRISLFSYLLSVCISLVFIKRYKMIPVVLVFSLIFTAFSGNLISRYERLIEVTKEKILKISDLPGSVYAETIEVAPPKSIATPSPTSPPVFEDRSTNIRLNVEWPRALRAFIKNPLLGTGYSSISLATDNDYLRLVGETGILGFLSFFLIFINLFIIFLQKFPLANYFKDVDLAFLAGVFGAIPGIFVNAIFIDVFEASKFAIIFWMLVGFAVALMYKPAFRMKKHEKNN